jgi:hypothetical protein
MGLDCGRQAIVVMTSVARMIVCAAIVGTGVGAGRVSAHFFSQRRRFPRPRRTA